MSETAATFRGCFRNLVTHPHAFPARYGSQRSQRT